MKKASTQDPIKIFVSKQEKLRNSSWEELHRYFAGHISTPFYIVDVVNVIEHLESKMELGYRSEDREYNHRMPIFIPVSDKFLIQFDKVVGSPLQPPRISEKSTWFFVLDRPTLRSSLRSVKTCVKALQRYQTKSVAKEAKPVDKLPGYVKQ